eukprot:scaffold66842_cov26-Tisochrysis_lutea.AAC.3
MPESTSRSYVPKTPAASTTPLDARYSLPAAVRMPTARVCSPRSRITADTRVSSCRSDTIPLNGSRIPDTIRPAGVGFGREWSDFLVAILAKGVDERLAQRRGGLDASAPHLKHVDSTEIWWPRHLHAQVCGPSRVERIAAAKGFPRASPLRARTGQLARSERIHEGRVREGST